MPNPYNDVELTEDDKQGIFEPVEAAPEKVEPEKAAPIEAEETANPQTHETESPEGATDVRQSDEFNLEDYEVEIDGEVYDGADILSLREDSSNKESWQASNTQKAQEIAKWSKFNEKVSSDTEFREYVKDYFYDNEDGLKSLGLDSELKPIEIEEEAPVQTEVSDNRIDEVSDRLTNMELEREVDYLEDELDSLVSNNKDLFVDENSEVEFLEFAQESGITDLTQAFKVWGYDKMQGELDHHRKLDGNKQRNQGKVVHNSRIGATEVSTPKTYKSVRDIDIEDPDVAKYFNR